MHSASKTPLSFEAAQTIIRAWFPAEAQLQTLTELDGGYFGAGYGKAVLDTPAKHTRRALYNVYLYLVMVIEDVFREYETHEITDWARANLYAELGALSIRT